jgi:thioesterase domain-containing protein/acyl carrier protein
MEKLAPELGLRLLGLSLARATLVGGAATAEVVAAPLLGLAENFVGAKSPPPMLADLVAVVLEKEAAAKARTSGKKKGKKGKGVLDRLATCPPAERQQMLFEVMATRVRQMLGMKPDDEIDREVKLQELGIDSLMTMELRNTVKADTGVALAPDSLQAHPDIWGLAGVVIETLGDDLGGGGGSAVAAGSPGCPDGIFEINPTSACGANKAPLFFVQGAGRGTELYADLAATLGADQPFYELRTMGLQPADGSEFGYASVSALAARYAANIHTLQPEGELQVGGWSFGGCVAAEIARVLVETHGRVVRNLVLVDWVDGTMALESYNTQVASVGALVRSVEQMAKRTIPDVEKKIGLHPEFQELEFQAKIDFALALFAEHKMLPLGTDGTVSAEFADELGVVVRNFEHAIRLLVEHASPSMAVIGAAGTKVLAVVATVFDFPGMNPFDWKSAAATADGAVDLHEMDCDHWAILRKPDADELAAKMVAALKH